MPPMTSVPSGAKAGFHTHPNGAASFSLGDAQWVNGPKGRGTGTGIPLYVIGGGEVRVCSVGSARCNPSLAAPNPLDSANPALRGTLVP